MDESITVIPLTQKEYDWASRLLTERWGSPGVVTRGILHTLENLNGFIAKQGEKRVGLITYRIHGNQCEIVSLDSLLEKQGVGTALIEAVKREATSRRCTQVWTITTNDNIEALRFWQKRDLRLSPSTATRLMYPASSSRRSRSSATTASPSATKSSLSSSFNNGHFFRDAPTILLPCFETW